ncbi:hypothetical protein [Kozakia baliensis]|uniref:hypothetical protein n=1 Tax=Kozakia baliensis TaxID=153496 RepID=UPI00087C430F|nr:hypothetical protein [Kozakia baliensis]AOX21594.1 hypothetical protein A0U90_13890 [Kozakia baliensis]
MSALIVGDGVEMELLQTEWRGLMCDKNAVALNTDDKFLIGQCNQVFEDGVAVQPLGFSERQECLPVIEESASLRAHHQSARRKLHKRDRVEIRQSRCLVKQT